MKQNDLNLNYEECPLCRGTGMFEDDDGYPDTCPECNGKGKVVSQAPEPSWPAYYAAK